MVNKYPEIKIVAQVGVLLLVLAVGLIAIESFQKKDDKNK